MAALGKRIADLEGDIFALESLESAAQTGERPAFSAAVTARSRLPSLRAELYRLRDLDGLAREKDPLKRIRATRQIAEREGSWQAVARLSAIEAEMEAKLAAAKAAEEAARLDRLSVDELFAYIDEALGAVPASIRAELVERLVGKHAEGA
jgi:TPP-dependent pyruvate/acetoin dehydrogenase alpha subunit